MQVEAAIDSWRQWDVELNKRPVLLETMSGGRSNRSFLLESGDRRMVLRLNGGDSILPAADRSHESTIWHAASEKGIAPPLLHVDEHHRFLVSEYVQNDLSAGHQQEKRVVEQAFSLLKQCHQLEVEAPSIDYSSHIEIYWKIIEEKDRPADPGLLEQREPMRALLEDIVNSDAAWGLCHHDPVIENFVGSPEQLYLIDWEYAAHGLMIMDYAAFAEEWGMDDISLCRQVNIQPELLDQAKGLYRYLSTLWDTVKAVG